MVFPLWLSMIAAEGAAWRRASWTCGQPPCRRPWRQGVYVVCPGGDSRGRERQAHPVRQTEKRPLTSSRGGQAHGRARGAGRREQGRQMRPLRISQITRIAQGHRRWRARHKACSFLQDGDGAASGVWAHGRHSRTRVGLWQGWTMEVARRKGEGSHTLSSGTFFCRAVRVSPGRGDEQSPQRLSREGGERTHTASSSIALCLRQEERRHGIVDTVPELFLDAQVVGAVCKLLDGKGETHILKCCSNEAKEPLRAA